VTRGVGLGVVGVALAGIVVGTTGCSSSPSRSECGPIVDHLVDVFTAGKLEEPSRPKDYGTFVEAWRRMLKDDKDATHDALMQVCTTQMSSGATSCILAAKTERDLATCLGQ
jgi:hypothetical protein